MITDELLQKTKNTCSSIFGNMPDGLGVRIPLSDKYCLWVMTGDNESISRDFIPADVTFHTIGLNLDKSYGVINEEVGLLWPDTDDDGIELFNKFGYDVINGALVKAAHDLSEKLNIKINNLQNRIDKLKAKQMQLKSF